MQVPKRRLRAALKRLGCETEEGRGKGSHWMAFRQTEAGKLAYTFPDRREYPPAHIKSACRQLELSLDELLSNL